MSDFIDIKQASELLGVSKDTIRRRLKSGEIKAEKRIGSYGEQWMIPTDQFNQAMQIQDAVPMTRLVTTTELQNLMQHAISNAVSDAVKAETSRLEAAMQELNQRLEKQEAMLQDHYRLIDERLRQTTKPKASFWKRLFS